MYVVSAVSVSESGVRPVLADAAEVARRALVALEPDGVGVHLGVSAEDDTAATHRFEATLPGYRGWQWAVVVAAPPGADHATVSESALLPALGALIAPDFVPWDQRVRPGDLGPGDLLATPADDPRLVPGYVATGDPVIDEVAREVGLGRVQVLSVEGRADAAQRWFTEYGPHTEMAKAAPATCGMCGFYLPLAGALRESFGVCGNAMGADGHVVHAEYGCGAHSDVVAPSGNGSPLYEAFDDHAVDFVEIVRPAVEDAINKAAPGAADEDATAADEVEPVDADPATAVVEVVAETTTDPAIEVVEVAVEKTAPATPEAEDVVPADSLTEVGLAAAEQAGDQQETAEAEAVAAMDAERAALAEGALPESADEVVSAEIASGTEVASATDIASATEVAPTDTGDARSVEAEGIAEASAAATETAAGADAESGTAAAAAEQAAGSADAPAEDDAAAADSGAGSGEAPESADLSEHGSSVSR